MAHHLERLSPASTLPRLLCLPYAGGRADVYRRWVPDLRGVLELWAVDLPGRYRRADEPMATDVDAAATAIAAEALDLTDRPLSIFGHSMGAMLGVEVASRLERRRATLRALIVSGCPAPQIRAARPTRGERSDQELVALLRSQGGTPRELLDDDEFLALALPTLRADLLLCDRYRGRPDPVTAALTALAGSADDTAPVAEVDAWRVCSTNWRGLRVLPGGHFFIHSARRATTDAVVAACAPDPWAFTGHARPDRSGEDTAAPGVWRCDPSR